MSKIIMSLIGALAFGWAVFQSGDAQAAPDWELKSQTDAVMSSGLQQGIELAQYHRQSPRYDDRGYRRPPPRYEDRRYRRPPPPHYGPRRHYNNRRCWTENRRVWTGRRWTHRPIRVCR